MKVTCRTLSILLLTSLSCVAAQCPGAPRRGAIVTAPPLGIFAFEDPANLLQLTDASSALQADDMSRSSSALPLLSCIGAGMALGGLLSARWWENRDK